MGWLIAFIIVLTLNLILGVAYLYQIRKRLDELIQVNKNANAKLDTHTKALGLVNKGLGSVFHAVKRNK